MKVRKFFFNKKMQDVNDRLSDLIGERQDFVKNLVNEMHNYQAK
jgi:hypothetical protein